jgi:hypothetical protein
VNKPRQAPESAEIRAQEEVRTQDEEARDERDLGDQRIQEALETAAEVAEKTGGLGQPGRGGHPAAAAGGRVPPARQELIPLVNPLFLIRQVRIRLGRERIRSRRYPTIPPGRNRE